MRDSISRVLLGLLLAALVVSVTACGITGHGNFNYGYPTKLGAGLIRGTITRTPGLSVRAAVAVPVAGAEVWLEEFPSLKCLSDANGNYHIIGVPAGTFRVVAKHNDNITTYKMRSMANTLVEYDEKVVDLGLLTATNIVRGVMTDESGTVLPQGTPVYLWGEVFYIGQNGSFVTPPLPTFEGLNSIFDLVVNPYQSNQFNIPVSFVSADRPLEVVISVPTGGSTSASTMPTVLLVAMKDNAIKTSASPNEQLTVTGVITPSDTSNDSLVWSATRGTFGNDVQTDGGKRIRTWTAPDTAGIATLSLRITAANGKIATASLPILVAETDATVKVAVLSNTPANPTNQTSADITVGGEGVTHYKARLDTGSWSEEAPVATILAFSNLAAGQHTIEVIGRTALGNWQTEANATVFTWTIDVTAKTAVLANTPANPTNQTSANITVGGDGIVAYKTKLDDGSWSAETVVATPVALSGIAAGQHVLKVIGKTAVGNWQAEANATSFTWTIDVTAPTVAVTTTGTSPTNTSPIPVTIEFSEVVTGFDVTKVDVINGTKGSLTEVTAGKKWTLPVTPSAAGEVKIDIAANKASDAAGNGNTAASQLVVTFDITNPTVSITSTVPSPTNTTPILATIEFSKVVTGFTADKVTVVNATKGTFTEVTTGKKWTLSVTPTAQGAVTFDIAANAVTDASGNGNTAASQLSITYETVKPGVTTVAVVDGTHVDVTFSEAMNTTDVTTAAKYAVSGTGKGSLAANPTGVALSSGNTYRLTWSSGEMVQGGDITITVDTGVRDATGNVMSATNSGTSTGGGIGVAPTVSAPINTAQILRSGQNSTSNVQSTEAGNIYFVKHGEAASTQTQINTAIAASKAFLAKGGADAATAYTVSIPAGLADGAYDLVAVDTAGNVSAVVGGWLTVAIDYTSANIGTLKYVPAGTFTRDATPTNTSTVAAFHMSQYEITQTQFTTVTGLPNPSNFTGVTNGPVERVSWYHALVFCNKLSMAESLTPAYSISDSTDPTVWGAVPTTSNSTWNAATCNLSATGYRLPTEAEWQWAAMGATDNYQKKFSGAVGTTDAGFLGGLIGDYAWYVTNGLTTTHEVGKRYANELGIFDMSGNVSEWCWDWYGSPYPTGALTAAYAGPDSGSWRVILGGHWGSSANNIALAVRGSEGPSTYDYRRGFRVVRP